MGLWKARGVHLSSTVHCFGFGGTPVSLFLWACWDNTLLPSQHLLSRLIGTPLSSNSKHCFTTSIFWRKVPESDARSVTTPLPSQHCSLGLLGQHSSTLPALLSGPVGQHFSALPAPALWACWRKKKKKRKKLSGPVGTILLHPPCTCSQGLWDTTPPSQHLLLGPVGTTLLHPPCTCSLGLLGQHSSTLPAPVLWTCWDNTPPPSLHLFSEPVTEALTSSTHS